MKRYLFLLILPLIMFCTSCEDFKGDGAYYISYGTIFNDDVDGLYIVTDEGDTLHVVENAIQNITPKDSARVIVSYSIKEKLSDNEINIKLLAATGLLTKLPVRLSEVADSVRDSLGVDPINVTASWFGAKKYLYVEYEIGYANQNKAHLLNIVIDEEQSTDDKVFLTLRHNAFGDPTFYSYRGVVSFDISGLIPEGKTEIEVVLQWENYEHQNVSDSGIFSIVDESPDKNLQKE